MLAFGMPGGSEWIILLILGLLIFGRRLPEVGRSLGRGIVEFKRGIKGIDDEIEDESSKPSSQPRIDGAARQDIAEEARSAGVPEATVGRESPNPYAPAKKATDQ